MKKPLVFVSDIHAHAFKSHSTITPEGINSRLADIVKALTDSVTFAIIHHAEAIIIPGDLFHVRGVMKPSILNRISECLKEAVFQGIDIHIIPGNHDMEHLSGGDTSVDSLGEIVFVDSDATYGVNVWKNPVTQLIGGRHVLFIPYIHDVEEFKEVLRREFIIGHHEVVVCHQGIDDFRPNAGIPSTGITSSLLRDIVGDFTYVFAGHYHEPKRDEKIISCGALVQHDFGDKGDRGLWLLDYNGASFHPVNSPKFITIDSERAFEPIKGNYIRIKSTNIKEAEKMKAMVEKEGASSASVEVVREFAPIHSEAISIEKTESMVARYIDIHAAKYGAQKENILKAFGDICG